MAKRLKIGFVGAGNVASHLAEHFFKAGHEISAIASMSHISAKNLAEKVNAATIGNLSDFPRDLDLIVIATSDSSVESVSNQLPVSRAIVCHTSGSINLSALSNRHKRAAVLYPLQTFSRDIPVDVSIVPFFVEATDESTLSEIEDFAKGISSSVYRADSEVRACLHVAGVLSSNFVIYLLEMTRKTLDKANLPLSTIKPLIETSISKALTTSPLEAITGPARRGDITTIRKQSDSINSPYDRAVYDSISEAILRSFNKDTTIR